MAQEQPVAINKGMATDAHVAMSSRGGGGAAPASPRTPGGTLTIYICLFFSAHRTYVGSADLPVPRQARSRVRSITSPIDLRIQ